MFQEMSLNILSIINTNPPMVSELAPTFTLNAAPALVDSGSLTKSTLNLFFNYKNR